jgi:hypothetical protein
MRIARAIFCCLGLGFVAGEAQALCRSTTSDSPDRDSEGCPIEGIPLYWKSECVGIHVDRAASRYLSLVDTQSLLVQGFATWIGAAGVCVPSISVVMLPAVDNPKMDYSRGEPAENDVLFRDDDWPYGSSRGETFDMTTAIFDKHTGEILDTNTELNGARISQLLETDADGGMSDPTKSNALRLLFTHVAGHFLGFDHSSNPDSPMYANFSLPAPDHSLDLTADDGAAMCAAYPESGGRPAVDAEGKDVVIPSTVCSLGAPLSSACSGSGSGLKLDHGCALAPFHGPSHREPSVLFAGGAIALFAAGVRRRRRRAISQ